MNHRLVVPYAPFMLRDETVEALQEDGWEPELRMIEGDDGYYQLLLELWNGQADLVVIEQDIVVRPGCVGELLNCSEPWCAFQYGYAGHGLHTGLGCVKFSAEAQRKVHGLIRGAGAQHDALHPPKHWCRLDTYMQRELRYRRRMRPHVHQPPVEHLGNHSHGCQRCGGEDRAAGQPSAGVQAVQSEAR